MNYRIEQRRVTGAKRKFVVVVELDEAEVDALGDAIEGCDHPDADCGAMFLDLRAAAHDLLVAEREARR